MKKFSISYNYWKPLHIITINYNHRKSVYFYENIRLKMFKRESLGKPSFTLWFLTHFSDKDFRKTGKTHRANTTSLDHKSADETGKPRGFGCNERAVNLNSS